MKGTGARALALAGLLLGAGLALVAGAQPWWRARGEGVSVAFTGTSTTAGLNQALALVVLAGTLLALAVRVRGRRVLGALLALAGAGAVVLGASRPRPSADAVRSEVREVSLADQFALSGTAWPSVFAGAGVVVLLAALLMLSTAGRWPARTARFERSGPARPSMDDPAAVWRSMDAGLDPTLDAAPEGGSDAGDRPLPRAASGSHPAPDPGQPGESGGADVHEESGRDTMGHQSRPSRGERGRQGAERIGTAEPAADPAERGA